jgi:hypothetical protein
VVPVDFLLGVAQHKPLSDTTAANPDNALAQASLRLDKSFKLESNMSFYSGDALGMLVCDTGASVTCLSSSFAARAGLTVRHAPPGAQHMISQPNGDALAVLGRVDLPVSVQLMLDWEVVEMGAGAPRDLFVAWADWCFDPSNAAPQAPLGHLAHMLAAGATLVNSPRPPLPRDNLTEMAVALHRVSPDGKLLGALAGAPLDQAALRSRILKQIPPARHAEPATQRFIQGLLQRAEIFTGIDRAKCTEVVEVTQTGVPKGGNLTQVLTKRKWDATHTPGDFKEGEAVLVHRPAPNRLLPHFIGPYTITSVSGDGNFVHAVHYLDKESAVGPVHVSRLLRFDASRAPTVELVGHQLDAGSYVVDEVLAHRRLDDDSYEFHLRWIGTPITSWAASRDVKKVNKVKEYCVRMQLPAPGTEPRRKRATAPAAVPETAAVSMASARGARAKQRGRGRITHSHTSLKGGE